ncbi:dienelactone hydrolase family protein [bacterium AH-315-P15]|nr:dienelactone hydrolase family protein [bacterium AH-315-P15]
MSGEEIDIQGPDGSFMGYLATPPSGTGPGIVVIQEIFGVNQVMRETADWLAGEGYVALVPDLFWRLERNVQITDKSDEDLQKAFELFGKFDADKGIVDIQATISHLRRYPHCSGKVGAVGYCLGGFLAYLSATRTDADASVGYYGVRIPEALNEAAKINKPLMLHVATNDEFVPPEAQAQMHRGLEGSDLITLHDYQGNDHAFARVGGAHYDQAAADLANSRTLAFFKANL